MSDELDDVRREWNAGLPLYVGLEPAPYTDARDLFGDWRFTCSRCEHVSAFVGRQTKAWALARAHAAERHYWTAPHATGPA